MTKKTYPQLLTEFMDGINQSINAVSCFIHQREDLRWVFVRKILEEIKDRIVVEAVNPLTAPKVTPHKKKTQILLP